MKLKKQLSSSITRRIKSNRARQQPRRISFNNNTPSIYVVFIGGVIIFTFVSLHVTFLSIPLMQSTTTEGGLTAAPYKKEKFSKDAYTVVVNKRNHSSQSSRIITTATTLPRRRRQDKNNTQKTTMITSHQPDEAAVKNILSQPSSPMSPKKKPLHNNNNNDYIPLSHMVQYNNNNNNNNNTSPQINSSNVNWILNFAIIGFPKTGTTTISSLLHSHIGHSRVVPHENCRLAYTNTEVLIRTIYMTLYEYMTPSDRIDLRRGVKCPSLLSEYGIDGLRYNVMRHFNDLVVIVGVRHPVRWLESFYNYRVREGHDMPWNTSELIRERCDRRGGGGGDDEDEDGGAGGGGWERTKGVCTGAGAFHYHLARLGKTTGDEEVERKLLFQSPYNEREEANNNRTTTTAATAAPWRKMKVFLYDVEQLADRNQRRRNDFLKDLSRFVGLKNDLKGRIEKKTTDRRLRPGGEEEKRYDEKKINICDERHGDVRSHLVRMGVNASRWILDYFLNCDEVFVSSRDYFEDILKSWGTDPCEANH